MAVQVPTAPELSAKLQAIVLHFVEINGQYQSTVYPNCYVTLRCDAEGWDVRDWWLSFSLPGGGQPIPAPPNGVKASGVVTSSTTAAQCDTLAATMIATIKAKAGPVFVNV